MLYNYVKQIFIFRKSSYINKKKDDQIRNKQNLEKFNEIKECTFRPDISSNLNKFNK